MCTGRVKPQSRLIVGVALRLSDGTIRFISALVDTGAEVTLVRKGLLPDHYFRRSAVPRRFVGANQIVLEGGSHELACTMLFDGVDPDTGVGVQVEYHTVFYDAQIGVEAILSYEWLHKNNVDVQCRKHGLALNGPQGPVWVAGMSGNAQGKQAKGVHQVAHRIGGDISGSGRYQPTEEYTVRWQFVQEILSRFRVEPPRDGFADEDNKRFPKCYTKEDNALSKDWGEDEVLWMNPPWSIWPEATDKLMGSRCAAICILPAWSKVWIQRLVGAASKKIYFEQGVRMFEVQGKAVANTVWGVWALLINKGERPMARKEDVVHNCVFIPRWRPLASMGTTPLGEGEVKEKERVKGPQQVATVRGEGARRALDLFTGTGSVARELENQGYEVISLD